VNACITNKKKLCVLGIGENSISPLRPILKGLCNAFEKVARMEFLDHYKPEDKDSRFFGNRDFIHLLKFFKRKSEGDPIIDAPFLLRGLERNFGG
jgi:hypothetical protein